MDWNQLLCKDRPSGRRFDENQELDFSSFERDFYTIVSSSYFRRLQRKAQVYVLDDNDFTRTRLTHSIEVSSIAEILGRRIGRWVSEIEENKPDNLIDDLSMVLKCAGLLHDFGNPPFGHSGEEYIRDYFEENEDKLKRNLSEQMWLDFINFEGNAHNIRIITKLGKSSNPNEKGFGMDLTCAVINSLIKYPYNSLEYNQREFINGKKKRGKIGYYHSEEWIIKKVAAKTGTMGATEVKGRKNPIMLIMEAADDIAYATADIEDAVKKGIIKKREIVTILNDIVPAEIINKDSNDESETGSMLRYVREIAMKNVIDTFKEKYEDIMSGTYQDDLINSEPYGNMIIRLKELMYEHFKKRDEEAEIKYNSKRKIHDILDYLIDCVTKEDKSFSDKLVIEEINQYLEKNQKEATLAEEHGGNAEQEIMYHNYMAVVDFVEGMTDSYVNIFWDELFTGRLISRKKKEFKDKCLMQIVNVKNFNQANTVLRDISLVDCWEDYEVAIILKCYVANRQINEAYESSSVISELYQNISGDSMNSLLTEDDITELSSLVVETE